VEQVAVGSRGARGQAKVKHFGEAYPGGGARRGSGGDPERRGCEAGERRHAALVVDIGGALSHAAIVARELGVPCVVNTVSGTRTIQTGDRLTPAATPRSPAPQHDQLSQQPV
jgi:hypothetical protein